MREIRKKFNQACVDYKLLVDGDRILVALSGGKDSLMLLHLLAERSRIYCPHISVEAAHVIMDNIPYESSRSYLEDFCRQRGIPFHLLHSSFDESTDVRKTRCFLCAWNRRKALFRFAEEHQFNKVALGHHQDDILATMLMNLTFEGSFSSMLPLTTMKHYPLQLIRPLCLVPEYRIRDVASLMGFEKQKVACPYEQTTHRFTMENELKHLEQINPKVRQSLWRALIKSQGA